MTLLLLKRIGYLVLTMVAVSILVFLLLEVSPGSVAAKVLGPYSTLEQRELWLAAHGYNEPVLQRYLDWLWRFFTGDFGESTRFKVPVADVLWRRLGNTAILGLTALAIIVPLSLVLGVLAGMREGSKLDRAISIGSIFTTSIPEFASAVFVAAIFVFWLGWLPGRSKIDFLWRTPTHPKITRSIDKNLEWPSVNNKLIHSYTNAWDTHTHTHNPKMHDKCPGKSRKV